MIQSISHFSSLIYKAVNHKTIIRKNSQAFISVVYRVKQLEKGGWRGQMERDLSGLIIN